jgi:ubiquinone/menaquinone biosynthesis C-methylase UbiE
MVTIIDASPSMLEIAAKKFLRNISHLYPFNTVIYPETL